MINTENDRLMYDENKSCMQHLLRKKTAERWMRNCWKKGIRFKIYNRNYTSQTLHIKPLNCSYKTLEESARKYGILTDAPENPHRFRFERAKFVLF